MALAFFPRGVEILSDWLHIEQKTITLMCVTIFLILIIFELLSIVSVQDRKITTLAQMVGILMEKQQLSDHAQPKKSDEISPIFLAISSPDTTTRSSPH